MRADLSHLLGELLRRLEQDTIFKVAEDFVPVLQGGDVADLLVEQPGYQLVLFPVTCDRVDDLVQVEVRDERAISLILADGQVCEDRGQQACKRLWRIGGPPRHKLRSGAAARLASPRWGGVCSRISAVRRAQRGRRLFDRLRANRLAHIGRAAEDVPVQCRPMATVRGAFALGLMIRSAMTCSCPRCNSAQQEPSAIKGGFVDEPHRRLRFYGELAG